MTLRERHDFSAFGFPPFIKRFEHGPRCCFCHVRRHSAPVIFTFEDNESVFNADNGRACDKHDGRCLHRYASCPFSFTEWLAPVVKRGFA